MRVLVAVDGSENSFEAVRQAGQLLSAERDDVTLYYSPPPLKLAGGATQAVIDRARNSLATAVFEEAKAQLPPTLAAKAQTIVDQTPPKHGILEAADKTDAAIIVVGARGMGPIERLLLGSVSSNVVHAARKPVLVARPRPADRAGQPIKIMVACESADQAVLEQVLSVITWPEGAIGYSMTVVQSMFAGHVPKWLEERARSSEVQSIAQAWQAEHEAEKERKREEIKSFDSRLPTPFTSTVPVVMEGNPTEQILAFIESHKIDLAVLGAHKQSSFERMLIGSTSRSVLNQAACSVLVAREMTKV